MKKQDVLRELTPLSDKDCFYVIERLKSEFNYPIHIHPEYELNYIKNAVGAQRIVGDSIEEIDDLELVLIADENLEHSWINHECKTHKIREITIQFHPTLLNGSLIQKNQFKSIKEMFDKAKNGIVFSRKTIERIDPLLMSLITEKQGFYSVIKLVTLLYELSQSDDYRVLSSFSFAGKTESSDSRRVKKAYDYINDNFKNKITLSDVASVVGMSDTSFSRFIKLRTSKSFTDFVIDVRLGNAIRMLVDSTHSISEIAFVCGFNNLSNFNRIFKKRKGLTPKEFREQYKKIKTII